MVIPLLHSATTALEGPCNAWDFVSPNYNFSWERWSFASFRSSTHLHSFSLRKKLFLTVGFLQD